MSEQHERINALEARIVELEEQLARNRRRRLRRPRLSPRAVIIAASLALLLPGIALADHGFSDVPNSNFFHDDIDWMADYNIAHGFVDGTYRPAQDVTRQAMAAFMHRLSNEFELVRDLVDPAAAGFFQHWAFCPGDKRAIAGGGFSSGTGMWMGASFPIEPDASGWGVSWETPNQLSVDPDNLTVYALCAPRL